MTATTKAWLKGLAAAAISSLVTAVNGVLVLPDVFNFTKPGLLNTAKLVVIPTIGSICLYLKKSPIPDTTVTSTTTTTTELTKN